MKLSIYLHWLGFHKTHVYIYNRDSLIAFRHRIPNDNSLISPIHIILIETVVSRNWNLIEICNEIATNEMYYAFVVTYFKLNHEKLKSYS